ncbi:MAG: Inositol 2-dehydrogenase [Betaproteobacteria bacterium]|nr:Inositol 2-dehydrogenase [Betaproteobacteria bacterium]
MTSSTKKCGWGIAGLGWVAGDFVVPAMVEAGSKLVGCVGSTPEKSRAFAQRFGFANAHDNLDSLLRDPAVDAVYLALPNAMHHEAVLAAARAKKHILCEKPFAMKLEHAREMAAACREAGVILRIAHQIRLDAAITRAREIVRSGRLGRLAEISLERGSANPARKTWRLDNSQSGVIFDVGVHLLDLIQWVSGQRFVEVSAFSHPDRKLGQSDDTITVLGRLDGECHAVARATREVGSAENNLIIEGADATLFTSSLRFAKEHVVSVRDKNGVTSERFPASPAYAWQVTAFEGEVRGERSLLPDGDDSLYTVATTQSVLQSINERRIVAVPAVA